jgi:hypothetical protein
MIEVSDSVVIARDPDDVFDIAADPERQLEWDAQTKSVEKLTPAPLGPGARYRVTVKGFGVIEYEFPEFDRPVWFSHRAHVKVGEMYHTFEFEPVPEGTRLTQAIRAEPRGIGRLLRPLMPAMLRKLVRTINAELKLHLEQGERPAAPEAIA